MFQAPDHGAGGRDFIGFCEGLARAETSNASPWFELVLDSLEVIEPLDPWSSSGALLLGSFSSISEIVRRTAARRVPA